MSQTDSFQDRFSELSPGKNQDQSNHNAHVAQYLFNTTKLHANDWVITISYYSIIHLFEYFLKTQSPILKFKGKEAKVSSLNEIISQFCDSGGGQKHVIRQKVVEENFIQIGQAWKFLSKGSYNARYNCYIVSNEIAQKGLEEMNKIRDFFKVILEKSTPSGNVSS
jgi:hypothetical protein